MIERAVAFEKATAFLFFERKFTLYILSDNFGRKITRRRKYFFQSNKFHALPHKENVKKRNSSMQETDCLRFLLILLICFLSINVFGQTEENTQEKPAPQGVKEIVLARDNGAGKAGEVVTGFDEKDVPIHCLIELNSTTAVAVQLKLVAVKADGLKPGTNVVTINYKTNGRQSKVNFNASPGEDLWAPGSYRFDVLLDGKPAASQNFEIKGTTAKPEKKEEKPEPKSAPKRKPAPTKKKLSFL